MKKGKKDDLFNFNFEVPEEEPVKDADVQKLIDQAWKAGAAEREAKKRKEKEKEQNQEVQEAKLIVHRATQISDPIRASEEGKKALRIYIALLTKGCPLSRIEEDVKLLVKTLRLCAVKNEDRSLMLSVKDFNLLYQKLVASGFHAKEKGGQLLELVDKFKDKESSKMRFAVYLYATEATYCFLNYMEHLKKLGKEDPDVLLQVKRCIAISKEFDPANKPVEEEAVETTVEEAGEGE